MENVKRLSEIEPSSIHRNTTGFDELDCIYGYTFFPTIAEWGMPVGKISLWSGESGTGKSRLCIDIVKHWTRIFEDRCKILYIMTESPLSDFATWAKDTTGFSNVFCSDVDKIEEIINIINYVQPQLIFIDSVNSIADFSGNSKSANRLIKGADGKMGLKQAVDKVCAHCILLGQLNETGTIKGGSSLPHLADIALDIVKDKNNPGEDFIVKIGIKNRHGKGTGSTNFHHTDAGVISTSESRWDEKKWRDSHLTTLPERFKTPAPIPAPVYVSPVATSTYVPPPPGDFIDRHGNPSIMTPEIQSMIDEHTRRYPNLIRKRRRGLLGRLNDGIGRLFDLDQ